MRYLIVEGERAYLTQRPAIRRSGFVAITILDLECAADRFCRTFRDRNKEFGVGEIAGIAGVSFRLATKWANTGVIRANHPGTFGPGNAARYSYEDCFAAGCLGALRRQGVKAKVLAKAFRILTVDAKTMKQNWAVEGFNRLIHIFC